MKCKCLLATILSFSFNIVSNGKGLPSTSTPRENVSLVPKSAPSSKIYVLPLSGKWRFMLDTNNEGKANKWYNTILPDEITLPGTTDEAKKGIKNTRSETARLTRVYTYNGWAWYQREVTIPANWAGKHIVFLMERTKTTSVWVDSTFVGSNNTLAGKQSYDLSKLLKPGKHRITVLINNRDNPPVGDPHQISDQTQTNWNGIIGKIQLIAKDKVWMDDVQLYPDVAKKLIRVKIKFNSTGSIIPNGTVNISARTWNVNKPQTLPAKVYQSRTDTSGYFEAIYPLGKSPQLWDEFSPAIYKINIDFKGKSGNSTYHDSHEINTGIRDFKVVDKQFNINGKTIFLRGKHDACVFPLTGYPPMTVEGWVKVLRVAKSYGINTYRFHSWCPPEAAFQAADIVGMYMQPELPIWGSIGRPVEIRVGDVEQRIDNDPVAQRTQYLMAEGRRILYDFGNYGSFTMFALGNELTGSEAVMADMIRQYRAYDGRHLYAQGSNNFLNAPKYFEGDDYWITTMTGGNYTAGNYRVDTRGKDVRSSYPVDTVGHINNKFVGTTYDYRVSIADSPVPVIGHEIGQFQTYPNFEEIKKYTGVVQARNFELFKKRLEDAGMGDEAQKFFKASGALAVLCYREEIETAIRTPGFGGFHLLDLQDFPGQGTALVGILDAFMDSKGLITPEEWRQFCNAVVPLVKMKSFIWTNKNLYTAEAEIANYGASSFSAVPKWSIASSDGKLLASGSLPLAHISQGKITSLGTIDINLTTVIAPQKLTLTLQVGNYKNTYPAWVYPEPSKNLENQSIYITQKLDEKALDLLQRGEKVLYFPSSAQIKNSIKGSFQTDFWSYTMFKKYAPPGTLGILTNPRHPALADFPTESHSNWQWWRLLRNSPVVILDSTDKAYRPVVQVIDNLERNHKLGLVFESKVGNGSLLVCSIALPEMPDFPEAQALYKSILAYMQGSEFKPLHSWSPGLLSRLFRLEN